jgi:tripartite-type tricarboxylate transporter receptor subunit TctC
VVAGGTGGEDAEGYLSNTVSLIMSYTAGGPAGLAAHSVASFMEKELGQSVAVENLLGGVGGDRHDRDTWRGSDGYKCMITSDTTVVTQLSEEAESNPRILNVGTLEPPQWETIELLRLKEEPEIEVTAAPLNSNVEMAQALLEGNGDTIFVNSSKDIVRQLDASKFRPLATASEERAPYLPEAQAPKELGYKTLTLATSFFALGAPAGMPEDTTAKLKETPQAALETPEVREELGEARPRRVARRVHGLRGAVYIGSRRFRLPASRY